MRQEVQTGPVEVGEAPLGSWQGVEDQGQGIVVAFLRRSGFQLNEAM